MEKEGNESKRNEREEKEMKTIPIYSIPQVLAL